MGAHTGATCVASRAQLLTGRGVFKLKGMGKEIPKEHVTIGEVFQKAGYHSHIVGKWHNDDATLGRMFDSGGSMMSRGIYLTDHYRMPLWGWRKRRQIQERRCFYLYLR